MHRTRGILRKFNGVLIKTEEVSHKCSKRVTGGVTPVEYRYEPPAVVRGVFCSRAALGSGLLRKIQEKCSGRNRGNRGIVVLGEVATRKKQKGKERRGGEKVTVVAYQTKEKLHESVPPNISLGRKLEGEEKARGLKASDHQAITKRNRHFDQ